MSGDLEVHACANCAGPIGLQIEKVVGFGPCQFCGRHTCFVAEAGG